MMQARCLITVDRYTGKVAFKASSSFSSMRRALAVESYGAFDVAT